MQKMTRAAMVLAGALVLSPGALTGPAAAQSDAEITAAVAAFLEEEAAELTSDQRAVFAACLTEAMLGLSAEEKAMAMAEADLEVGLGAVIRQRPAFEDEIERCEG